MLSKRNYAGGRWRGPGTRSRCPVPWLHDAPTTSRRRLPIGANGDGPEFVKGVTASIMSGNGDDLPVSAVMPSRRHVPRPDDRSGRSANASPWRFPIWDKDICIQCGLCSVVCPHAAIRMKAFPPTKRARTLPKAFKRTKRGRGKVYFQGMEDDHPGRPGRLHRLRRLR